MNHRVFVQSLAAAAVSLHFGCWAVGCLRSVGVDLFWRRSVRNGSADGVYRSVDAKEGMQITAGKGRYADTVPVPACTATVYGLKTE